MDSVEPGVHCGHCAGGMLLSSTPPMDPLALFFFASEWKSKLRPS